MDEIVKASKRAGLHGFETLKSIYIESEPFSAANNLLTPTQKLKRVEVGISIRVCLSVCLSIL